MGLTLFALARGYGAVHSVQEGLIVAFIAAGATAAGRHKRVASLLVSLGLITSSAILVHLWGGVIEAHFHFFVMIVLLTLYEDWLPFLGAAAYVFLQHGLAGAINPHSVYNHQGAVTDPWKWAAIHGLFVTAAGIGAVAAWRLNEDVRAESRRAYANLARSEELLKGAFHEGPTGMALSSLEAGHEGRFVQINRALCDITGYSEEELLTRTFFDITHPDDREETLSLWASMRRGEQRRFRAETRCVRADGTAVFVLLDVSLIGDADGAPIHTIAHIQDITERKRAQEQLAYQANHDVLTGLPNRRRLIEDLGSHLRQAAPAPPSLLMLFDLDGFKAYNDAFGHMAGDALLSRLGSRLEAAVGSRGACYRMGGDEFCLFATLEADEIEPLVAAATRALSETGEGFTVGASFGCVRLPEEADDPIEALRKADKRMYSRKAAGRASAGRQATDALLSVLNERSPELGLHLQDVTELCEALGRRLELPSEEMTALLQAAALHDVGKVAIPDTILDKPGPLGDDEWRFVRTHTLVGERILAAAPALTHAAKLVRWSHERFDGGGYPDGLRGEEIPLAARIISLCDAYHAMTADRTYRKAMSREVALAEIRRHAGTQFDPAIVAPFEAALADMKAVTPGIGAPAAAMPGYGLDRGAEARSGR